MFAQTFSKTATKTACAVGLASLAVTALTGSASARPGGANPADSFLPVASSSVAETVRQVETNPTVRRHYAKYFNGKVPESQIANYLRHNLRQTRLSRTGRYTMYLVRPNGLIYPTVTTLPKGATIYTLQTNPPRMLTGRDGNPIMQFAPQVNTVYVPAPSQPSGANVKVLPSRESQILAPVKVQETILPTTVGTPIYRPASPLTSSEQSPETASTPPPANP